MENVQVSGDSNANGQQQPSSPTTSVRVGPVTMDVSNRRISYLGQLLASIVLLISVTAGYKDYDGDKEAGKGHIKHYEYAIAASVVAMIVNLAILLKPDIIENGKRITLRGTDVSSIIMFLVVWWCIAVGVLTYHAPFVVTGNGYFATWGGFIFSLLGVGITGERIKGAFANLYMGLCICSIVVICAIPKHWGDQEYQTETIFALVVSASSLAITTFIMDSNEKGISYPTIVSPLLFLLAALWTVAACLATFRGPFLNTGNGYFGLWGGCALTLIAVDHSLTNQATENRNPDNDLSEPIHPNP